LIRWRYRHGQGCSRPEAIPTPPALPGAPSRPFRQGPMRGPLVEEPCSSSEALLAHVKGGPTTGPAADRDRRRPVRARPTAPRSSLDVDRRTQSISRSKTKLLRGPPGDCLSSGSGPASLGADQGRRPDLGRHANQNLPPRRALIPRRPVREEELCFNLNRSTWDSRSVPPVSASRTAGRHFFELGPSSLLPRRPCDADRQGGPPLDEETVEAAVA